MWCEGVSLSVPCPPQTLSLSRAAASGGQTVVATLAPVLGFVPTAVRWSLGGQLVAAGNASTAVLTVPYTKPGPALVQVRAVNALVVGPAGPWDGPRTEDSNACSPGLNGNRFPKELSQSQCLCCCPQGLAAPPFTASGLHGSVACAGGPLVAPNEFFSGFCPAESCRHDQRF